MDCAIDKKEFAKKKNAKTRINKTAAALIEQPLFCKKIYASGMSGSVAKPAARSSSVGI